MRTSLIKSLAVVGCALVLAGVGILAFGRSTVYAQDEQPTYVGTKECASCHRSLARDHAETNHALALQEVGRKQEEIIADFSTGEDVRMTQFPDEDAPRPFTADDIAYVVGAGVHVQRYLYEIDRNEYIVLPAEWNVADQKWQRLDLGAEWTLDNYGFTQKCAGCHTTGLDVERGRWKDDGVQCEDCHGPASNHVNLAQDASRNPSDQELADIRAAIYRGADPQVCGACHSQGENPDGLPYPVGYTPGANLSDFFTLVPTDSGDHWWLTGHGSQQNMQYNEWLTSTHSTSLTDMQASDYAADKCLACHSQDARQVAGEIAQVEAGDRDGAPLDPVTLADAQWGVTCTTCHNQHTDSGEPFSLVMAANDLCTSCHTQPADANGIHHPVTEMFEGVAVVDGIDGVPGTHFSQEDGPRCVTCHMQQEPVADETTRSSHGFKPILPGESDQLPSACAGCHTTLTTTDLSLLVTNTQAAVKARIDAARAQLASLTKPTAVGDLARYQQASDALDFVAGDGSFGVHNYTYADALLTAAENDLNALTGTNVEVAATEPAVPPTPGPVVIVRSSAPDDQVGSGVRPVTFVAIGVVIAIFITAAVAFFRKPGA